MANARIRSGLLLFGLAGIALVPAGADSGLGGYVIPGSKAAGLSSCVRETPFMRRNHMELILHQRDLTVHQGIRGVPESLAGCVDCHVGYDDRGHPVSVYAEGQFCRSCHEFTAVDLDCFGCHATVPMPPPGQLRAPEGGGESAASDVSGAIARSSPAGVVVAGRPENDLGDRRRDQPGQHEQGEGR